ncbi:31960_t:CDS:2, partial [Racocetra persica]
IINYGSESRISNSPSLEISGTVPSRKILPIPEEDSSSTSAKAEINIDYDDVYFDEEFDYDSTAQTVKEMNKKVASQLVKIGDDSDSDEPIDSNHPIHDILLREEIARLERISNSPGNSTPTPQTKAGYHDDGESNEVKSDDDNDSSDFTCSDDDEPGYYYDLS